jgi:hypothetical protein
MLMLKPKKIYLKTFFLQKCSVNYGNLLKLLDLKQMNAHCLYFWTLFSYFKLRMKTNFILQCMRPNSHSDGQEISCLLWNPNVYSDSIQ